MLSMVESRTSTGFAEFEVERKFGMISRCPLLPNAKVCWTHIVSRVVISPGSLGGKWGLTVKPGPYRLEKIVIDNRSHRVEHSAPNRQIDDCFQPNGEIFHDSFLSMQCVGSRTDRHGTRSN